MEDAKKRPPKKIERSRAELEASAKRHRGRKTAAEARELIRRGAPSLVLGDKIVPASDEVTGVLSDRVLQVKAAGERRTQVLQSNLPLAKLESGSRKDGTAKFRVADLDWEAAGDRFTMKRPVSNVSLPRTASGEVRLGDDVSMRLAPEGSDAVGTPSGESVTYPNIASDTDMTVRSLPTGFGVGWTLRSPNALRQLRVPVELPAGQRLSKTANGAVIIVSENGDPVTEITPAVATDADQQPVPLETEIDGDTIIYSVDHAEGETAYPVAVDPYTVPIGSVNAGWRTQNTPQPSAPYQYFGSAATTGTLSIFAPPGYYAQYESAAWARFSPGNPALARPTEQHGRWTSFTAGGVSYTWAGNQYYHVFNRPQGKIFAADHLGNIQQPPVDVAAGTSGGTFSVTPTGFSNQIGFGLTSDGGAFFNFDHPQAGINMAWYTATAADTVGPAPSTTYAGSWVDPSTNPSISIRGTDNGLGVQTLELLRDGAGVVDGTTTLACPPVNTQVCPFDSGAVAKSVVNVPEGVNPARVRAVDAAGVPAEAPLTLRIDKSAPGLELSGSLWESRDILNDPVDDEDDDLGRLSQDGILNVKADDSRSGVASIEVRVDGTLLASDDRVNVACGSTGCPTTSNNPITIPFASVPEGDHEITVIARDQLANPNGTTANSHTRVERFTVHFEAGQNPTSIAATPGGPDAPDDPVQPDTDDPTTVSPSPPLGGILDPLTPAGTELNIVLIALLPGTDLNRVLGGGAYTVKEQMAITKTIDAQGTQQNDGRMATLTLATPRAVDQNVGCFASNSAGDRQAYRALFKSPRVTEIEVKLDVSGQLICVSPGSDVDPATSFDPAPGQPALPAQEG